MGVLCRHVAACSARNVALELRDHAQQILEAIARGLSAPQTRQAQLDKSRGLTHVSEQAPETAAQPHAVPRAP